MLDSFKISYGPVALALFAACASDASHGVDGIGVVDAGEENADAGAWGFDAPIESAPATADARPISDSSTADHDSSHAAEDAPPTVDDAPPPLEDAPPTVGDATPTLEDSSQPIESGSRQDAGECTGATSVSALLALTQGCAHSIGGPFNVGSENEGYVCELDKTHAVYTHGGMVIDCDGVRTDKCNETTDSMYYNGTSLEASTGGPLDAAMVPYFVLPSPSPLWQYDAQGATPSVTLGAVGAVVYDGKVEFGIWGDTGGYTDGFGEASYAMAERLGIDPDPAVGGASTGVTYVLFTGEDAIAARPEDHAEVDEIGCQKLAQLLAP